MGFVSVVVVLFYLSSIFAASERRVVKIDGSSTVFPITEAVAEEFQKEQKGKVQVTVGISGTGGGFKKFCRGETDIQDASRPILKSEMEICKAQGISYIELPIAYDAITIIVSHQNTWVKNITVASLKTLWEPGAQGKITQWNHVLPEWPNKPIKLFGAGSDSGTFDYFTEAVTGKSKSSRGDYTASEDDNTLVLGVSSNPQALGYIPFSYYEANKKKLKALSVGGVFPSEQTIEQGTYTPFSRPIFIYVSAEALKKQEVKSFSEFYLHNAYKLAKQVKYVPLPQKLYTLALENLKKEKRGTVFGGKAEIGLKVEELLKREIPNL
ncbi:MAG: PstS family phosphate ABC transporter substrate-binding protein [Deltaproteobacteria bacterium]|nr:PstS family phosphate ABC transporter substrate-binding protein [Deltaproteobacteria bacterium]